MPDSLGPVGRLFPRIAGGVLAASAALGLAILATPAAATAARPKAQSKPTTKKKTTPKAGKARPKTKKKKVVIDKGLAPTDKVLKASDLSVKAKWRSQDPKRYEFVIRNDGDANSPATSLRVTLGPPCSQRKVITERFSLETISIKSLKPTVSKSMEYKAGYVLPEQWYGTGCEIHGVLDPSETIVEKDETNNVARKSTRYVPRPDLVVQGRYNRSKHKYFLAVQNVGDAASPAATVGSFRQNTYDGAIHDSHYGSIPVPALQPRRTWVSDIDLPGVNQSGIIWAYTVDPDNEIMEWSESNNDKQGGAGG